MLKRLSIAVPLALLAVLLMVFEVGAVPPLPFTVWGTVKVDGVSVPAGTVVTAGCLGVQYATTPVTIDSGLSWYLLNIPGDDLSTTSLREGCRAGETVSFSVDGLPAEQTSSWAEGTSVRVDLTVISPPLAPTGVSASDGTYTDKVRVSWTASSRATYYQVYRNSSNSNSGASLLGSPTASPYDDTAASAGTTYWYFIKACSAAGCSTFSTSDSGYRAITAPTGVSASDGTYTDKVRVSWTASTGATYYEVYRNSSNSNSGASLLGSPTASPYDDTAASAGTAYWYFIKACSAAGCSTFSTSDSGSRALAIPLVSSWNLISLPLIPQSTEPATVFASLGTNYSLVYAYDGCLTSNQWTSYNPNIPPILNTLTSVNIKQGLWVQTTTPVTLKLTGTWPISTSINLCTGWNLIGYPSSTAQAVATALTGISGKYSLVYGYDATDTADPWKKYDPAFPAGNDLALMQPGWGYWIQMTASATLVVPGH